MSPPTAKRQTSFALSPKKIHPRGWIFCYLTFPKYQSSSRSVTSP